METRKLRANTMFRSIAKRHKYFGHRESTGNSLCRRKGGLNFVEIMLKLAREKGKVRVVDDESLALTFKRGIAEQIGGSKSF